MGRHSLLRIGPGPGARALVFLGLKRTSLKDSGRPRLHQAPPLLPDRCQSALLRVSISDEALTEVRLIGLDVAPVAVGDVFLMPHNVSSPCGVQVAVDACDGFVVDVQKEMCAGLGNADCGTEENRGLHVQIDALALRVVEDGMEAVRPAALHAGLLGAAVDVSLPLLAIVERANARGTTMRTCRRLLQDAVFGKETNECQLGFV